MQDNLHLFHDILKDVLAIPLLGFQAVTNPKNIPTFPNKILQIIVVAYATSKVHHFIWFSLDAYTCWSAG
jgi:hypothetical protein